MKEQEERIRVLEQEKQQLLEAIKGSPAEPPQEQEDAPAPESPTSRGQQ